MKRLLIAAAALLIATAPAWSTMKAEEAHEVTCEHPQHLVNLTTLTPAAAAHTVTLFAV